MKEVPALEPNELQDLDFENWLGGRDSNPDNLLQRQMSYRWTTSQHGRERHYWRKL